jgi:mannose-1-phosphate guanylyltransferase
MLQRRLVILAGGSGERLWPLSTPYRPKQFCRLIDPQRSLLQQTVDRLRRLFPEDSVHVITSAALHEATASEVNVPVLAEPLSRSTYGAIRYAVEAIGDDDPQTVFAFFPADHYIGDEAAFRATVDLALSTAAQRVGIGLIGLQPTRPETGYGYFRCAPGSPSEVFEFREKPDMERAVEYYTDGDMLWNGGMFFFRRSQLDLATQEFRPDLAKAWELGGMKALPKVAFDEAILESRAPKWAVRGHFDWDDIGSWDSAAQLLIGDAGINKVLGRGTVAKSANTLLWNDTDAEVIVYGIDHAVVVCVEGKTLVMDRRMAARLREVLRSRKT